jgi:hypothetical protein
VGLEMFFLSVEARSKKYEINRAAGPSLRLTEPWESKYFSTLSE